MQMITLMMFRKNEIKQPCWLSQTIFGCYLWNTLPKIHKMRYAGYINSGLSKDLIITNNTSQTQGDLVQIEGKLKVCST